MDETGRPQGGASAPSLREAMRAARLESAERAGVVVELRDAELARLAMLNELLEPVFAEIPIEHADLFDRGLMPGETPRLFIDMVAHIAMGRDRRTYRLLQDTRAGRHALAESTNANDIVDAVTRYVARRLVAREQAMTAYAPEDPALAPRPLPRNAADHGNAASTASRPRRGPVVMAFLIGLAAGAGALFLAGGILTGR